MKEGLIYRLEQFFDSYKKMFLILLFITLILVCFSGPVFCSESTDLLKAGSRLGFEKSEDVLANNALIQGDNKITVNGGSIKYNHGGKFREYNNLKEGAKFTFNDKKLTSAEFETTEDSTYTFGNHELKAPKGSKVIFKDNKVSIQLPKGASIEKPTMIAKAEDSKDSDCKIEYKYAETPDSIKIKDGKEYTLTKSGGGFNVNYDGKADAFLIEGEYTVNGIKMGEFDSNNRKNYLFFDGAKHDLKEGSYVSIGDKIVIGAAKGYESPSVQFLKDNGVLTIKDKDFIVMQSNGGTITVEKRDSEGKIPRVTSQGDYTIFAGDKVVRYKEEYKTKYGGPLLKANKNNLGVDFSTAGTTPMQIVSLDSNGERAGKWDVVVNNDRGIYAASHELIEGEYSRVLAGQAVSIRSSFYSLNSEELNKLKSLSSDKQKEFIGMNSDQIKEKLSKVSTETKTNIPLPFKDRFASSANKAINSIRADYRSPSLKWDDNLAKGAAEWSEYMAKHYGKLEHADIRHIPGVYAENIALNYGSLIREEYGSESPENIAKALAKQWKDSSGHLTNIVNGAYTKQGIGIYVRKLSNGDTEYWATQRFH